MTADACAARISAAQWNRTLLDRQHLLARVDEDAIEVIDRIVGMQSQDPVSAFYALWSRIEGFDPTELDDLLINRDVVRMVLLRGTVFLVDGLDARWIRPLAQPRIDAGFRTNHRLVRADPDAVIADAAELLAKEARRGTDLGRELALRHPEENPTTLTVLARCALPLVQIPPRGLWGGAGAPTYRLLDDWIGPGEPALVGEEAHRELIRLYLRGFGPATAKAVQTWSGITGLRPLLDAMERDWELVRLAGPDGEVLFDLDGLGLADPDVPAPVRLIAPFDHVLVAQGDRARIADDDHFRRTVTANGRSPGFVLVDGRLAGTWRIAEGEIDTELFVSLDRAQRAEFDDEVERLRTFAAGTRT
ncbi:winged helix DNA-binding domain-containing protein [Gordonia sp. NPDC003429]